MTVGNSGTEGLPMTGYPIVSAAGEDARLTRAAQAGEDARLTRAAQAGDIAALGLLLEQHRAGMRAVALSILGPGPDADDAVQDATLIALCRIGDVRDPEAVGAWLRMIVRNQCRGLLSDHRPPRSCCLTPRPPPPGWSTCPLHGAGLFLDDPGAVAGFTRAFTSLRSLALSPAESAALIREHPTAA